MNIYSKFTAQELIAYYIKKKDIKKSIENNYKTWEYPIDYTSARIVMSHIEEELKRRGIKISGKLKFE